jgi:hypothetical protein
MTIVVAGDSFVYGSELSDCTRQSASKKTFFALLANDFDYRCIAVPGLGNDGIARQVVTACETMYDVEAVAVSWTFPGRYEYRFAYDTGERGGNWHTITPWTTIEDVSNLVNTNSDDLKHILSTHSNAVSKAQSTGVADFAEVFYKHVGSTEYWELYSSLKEIVYLQNYLKVKGIPYIFTCADNSVVYNNTVSRNDTVINSLLKQIDFLKWFWFPSGEAEWETKKPRGFYQWALENKYPIGATHPLEDAHKDAAMLMQEKFNELVKKNLQQN